MGTKTHGTHACIKARLKDYKKVFELAADGLNAKQIAAALGVCRATFFNHMQTDPKLREAFDDGAQAGIGEAVHILKEMARERNLGALIFWLKNRDPENWRDDHSINTKISVRKQAEELTDEQLNQIIQVETVNTINTANTIPAQSGIDNGSSE
jgi:hypothetical protein